MKRLKIVRVEGNEEISKRIVRVAYTGAHNVLCSRQHFFVVVNNQCLIMEFSSWITHNCGQFCLVAFC